MQINKEIKILLLDNHNVERELIREILTSIGCLVTASSNEQESVRLFNKEKYDLVILDQNTLESDVDIFVAKLSEIDPLTPIAMMVTIDTSFYVDKYRESNIDFLISKPFGYSQLANLVKEAIELSQKLK